MRQLQCRTGRNQRTANERNGDELMLHHPRPHPIASTFSWMVIAVKRSLRAAHPSIQAQGPAEVSLV